MEARPDHRTCDLRAWGGRVLLAVAALVVAALATAAPAHAAAPPYILVSGPPYTTPLLLGDQRENLALYQALVDAPSPPADVVAGLRARPRVDLAVFWWRRTGWEPSHPADAKQHGSFYPRHRSRPAVIELMANGSDRPRLLTAAAARILSRQGVALTAPAIPCPISLPKRTVPPGAGTGPAGFNYGNRLLRAHLYWPDGILTAGPLQDGAVYATVDGDGSISVKVGWWRRGGRLRITGRRLDGEAPSLRSHVPGGYGASGFQPTGITFPTEGCWQVVGRSGNATLAFVLWVAKTRD